MAVAPTPPKSTTSTPKAPPSLTRGEKQLVGRLWRDNEKRIDELVAYLLVKAREGYEAGKVRFEAYLKAK